MKKNLGVLLAVGAILSQEMDGDPHFTDKSHYPHLNNPPKNIDKSANDKPCPPGCKTYFFDATGNYSTERMRRDECVFICHAINDKNAKRKFEKFQKLT